METSKNQEITLETGGATHDAALYTRAWGFRLQDVPAEVHLWYGGQDRNVPVSVGQFVADALPDCSPRFYDDEGHLTLCPATESTRS